VLVHGIGASHRYLAALHVKLAETADTYSFDLPGFGGTPKPKAQLSIKDYAAFISAVLTAAGVQSCVLVGHSMGAQFGIELALQSPALVSHLVLMCPVVDNRRRTALQLALALGRDTLREPPAANAMVFTDYLRCGPRWYLTEMPVMMAYRTEERIGLVGVPVLVLRGTRDPVARLSWCRLLAHRASDGRLLQFPGDRHVVQYRCPARVAQAIAEFAELPAMITRRDL
jgi:pimeloyl-ACP methyl ester carboxylesterase